ncbi:hypothetical protein GGI25_000789 [Coemansia spiralis]|uniref:RRM Nup35-type domain-containing protein n=2 Tax=Coemansia TaxID=4863 RepID=A0A9W8G781_9FUNG|nr:hypothetical protein BX070DRAFT_223042 [Coemansia spiralis]KAJ1988389.1 hypothetical protein EDC05_005315 [Coemansia umbellata]KAJ2621090.1 hypothetical protein GGI26_004434 [Coemansia sp. RSA 1358]KAJ2680196.1 hypothetical protein GGI25_000789 [Coemansia spiralis]
MSYAPTQPVGGRVRFPPPPTPSLSSGLQTRGDLFTPTRQSTATSSPFRTVLRRSAYLEPEPNANPFTPRPDRGASPVSGSRTLARRNTTLGTVSRGNRTSLYQTGPTSTSKASTGIAGDTRLPLPSTNSSEDISISMGGGGNGGSIGGIGAWPSDTYNNSNSVSSLGIGGSTGIASDVTSKTPFARPRSPAPRSASPHKSTKKLPSFLLGSAQPGKSSSVAATYQPDTALTSASSASSSVFGLSSARLPNELPLSSHPISPRVSRRLSGFGSNDMLSSAYKSSVVTAAGRTVPGTTTTLEDAPPIVTLDDMDDEKPNVFLNGKNISNPAQLDDADPFSSPHDAHNSAYAANSLPINDSENNTGGQDYEDVKIRSVLVSGLPPESESSALNQFRVYGEILAFVVAPSKANSLALLYAEPWQAQRAVAQGGNAGCILIGDRTLASISWADVDSTSLLYKKVFPGRAVPASAAQPNTDEFTLSQAIYAQSPRKRPLSTAQQNGGGSRIDKIRETEAARSSRAAGPGSPFRQQRFTGFGGFSTSETAAGINSASSVSVLKASATPRPRNGLLQSALDILFGW